MSTKTWQDRFRERFLQPIQWIKLNCKNEIISGVDINNLNLELEQFITDLRKHDEEELIKLLKYFSFLDRDSEYYQHNLEQLIISHYAK